jgi:hypothetical protein
MLCRLCDCLYAALSVGLKPIKRKAVRPEVVEIMVMRLQKIQRNQTYLVGLGFDGGGTSTCSSKTPPRQLGGLEETKVTTSSIARWKICPSSGFGTGRLPMGFSSGRMGSDTSSVFVGGE